MDYAVVYVILTLCMFSLGIRFTFFSSSELNKIPFYTNEKRELIKKRYKIYGITSLLVDVISIVFMFVPLCS